MYIEITTRCNMFCAHCGVDAKATGEDMTFEVFKEALKVCPDVKMVTLGGGEPTIHPEFMKMIEYAIEVNGAKRNVGITTNGSMTDIALKLADMTDKGIISASLSLDKYHSKIDNRVVKRYSDKGRIKSFSEVKNIGRGKNIPNAVDQCFCPMLNIAANGDIYTCGCRTEYLGTVFDYNLPEIGCSVVDLNKYICSGYCSNYGHVTIEDARPKLGEIYRKYDLSMKLGNLSIKERLATINNMKTIKQAIYTLNNLAKRNQK